jgi:hypothetical protein
MSATFKTAFTGAKLHAARTIVRAPRSSAGVVVMAGVKKVSLMKIMVKSLRIYSQKN